MNANRHLINVNPKFKTVMTELFVRNFSVDEYYENDYDRCVSDDGSW